MKNLDDKELIAAPAYYPASIPDQPKGLQVIDVRRIAKAWWRGRWLILCALIAGTYFGVNKLHSFAPAYIAEMVVEPTAAGPSGSQSPKISSSALSLLGLEQSKEVTPFERLKMQLGSVGLAKRLQEKYGYLQVFYGGSWDAEKGQWQRPQGRFFELRERAREWLRFPTWKEPTLEALAGAIRGAVVFDDTTNAPFVRITVRHQDPEFAKNLLERAVTNADALLRDQDKERAESRKRYIEDRLANASVLELRNGLVGMLVQEESNSIMLEGDTPSYSFRVVEPPRLSSSKTQPNVIKHFWSPVVAFPAAVVFLITVFVLFRHE